MTGEGATAVTGNPGIVVMGCAVAGRPPSVPQGLVIACSALKRSYRDAIRALAPQAVFLHLDGAREVLASRLENRSGHFMPAALLESQLATLEPLGPDESGTVVDIAASVDDVVAEALAGLSRARALTRSH
jgi:carbohydrate kinase (thermoresistant glucokinase family)